MQLHKRLTPNDEVNKNQHQATQKQGRKRRAEDEPSAAGDESTNAKNESSNSTDSTDALRTSRPRPRPRPCGKKARVQTREEAKTREVD
jgi:hypothetical protein